MSPPEPDLADLPPDALARLIGELPDELLGRLLTGETRRTAIDEVIRRFGDYVDSERTRGTDAAVAFVIGRGRERDRFIVHFADGEVSAGRDLSAQPRVTLELEVDDFMRLVTANADPVMLYLSGRLALSGDELFALEMASFLSIPGAQGTSAAAEVDPTAIDAAGIAAVVRDAPDKAIRSAMAGGIRGTILDEIFRRFPEYVQPGRAAELDTAIGFKLTGGAGAEADRYRVRIRRGEVLAGRDLDVDPRVTIVIDGADFLKLVTGNANPVKSFITGRLKVRGDLGFAAQLPGIFRIPSAAS